MLLFILRATYSHFHGRLYRFGGLVAQTSESKFEAPETYLFISCMVARLAGCAESGNAATET